ncbi:hypothetical protein PTKIN_Ptkin03bG0173900 [Pterospermum kingtungense]
MGILLGDGSRILFWSMEWITGVVLEISFPRIFALAANKGRKVKDYGKFANDKWTWEVQLRRRLFD